MHVCISSMYMQFSRAERGNLLIWQYVTGIKSKEDVVYVLGNPGRFEISKPAFRVLGPSRGMVLSATETNYTVLVKTRNILGLLVLFQR